MPTWDSDDSTERAPVVIFHAPHVGRPRRLTKRGRIRRPNAPSGGV